MVVQSDVVSAERGRRAPRAAARSSESRSTSNAGTSRNRWIRLALLAAIIAGAAVAAWRLGFFELRDPKRLADAIARVRGIHGVEPLFVLAYALIAAVGLPAAPLTLAGGAIFGLTLGSMLNWLGAVLGASGSYLLARVLGKDALRGMMGKLGGKLETLSTERGFMSVFRLRLIPVMPFNVLSLAAGAAGVPFREFVAGTALGIIPGTIIYTYFAESLIAGVSGAGRRALIRVTIAAILLIAVSFAPTLLHRLRRPPQEKS